MDVVQTRRWWGWTKCRLLSKKKVSEDRDRGLYGRMYINKICLVVSAMDISSYDFKLRCRTNRLILICLVDNREFSRSLCICIIAVGIFRRILKDNELWIVHQRYYVNSFCSFKLFVKPFKGIYKYRY